MKYRALVSFTGVVSMAVGEVREIADSSIAKPLLKVNYIEEIKEAKPPKRKEKGEKTDDN